MLQREMQRNEVHTVDRAALRKRSQLEDAPHALEVVLVQEYDHALRAVEQRSQ